MKKLVLHIPHSSAKFPFGDGYVLSATELREEVLKLTDWHTEDLFASDKDTSVIFDFSRIFCDPERFADDEEEVMAKFGMGVLYETTDDGRVMRKVSSELRKRIIKEYYEPHHALFAQAVKEQLKQNSKALLIDCHSFCDTPFKRDLDKRPYRPDICLGTDEYHTSEKLLNFSIRYFENNGLSVAINTPYPGTIVPLEFYKRDKRVQSIMVEVNRKLYLQDGTNFKSNNYQVIKEIVQGYLAQIKEEVI